MPAVTHTGVAQPQATTTTTVSLAEALAGTTSTASSTASPASAPATPTLAAGVGMQDMIESIRASIQMAARQGIAQARIALHPEDLGHITIRLTQTSDGLLARVSAETPAAIQALTDARSELHRSLSSLGGAHVRLDINSFGNPQAGSREDRAAGNPGTGSSSNSSNDPDTTEDAAAQQAGADVPAPVSSRPGALVDVLA